MRWWWRVHPWKSATHAALRPVVERPRSGNSPASCLLSMSQCRNVANPTIAPSLQSCRINHLALARGLH